MLDGLLHWAYSTVDRLGRDADALDGLRLALVHAYVPFMSALVALTAAALLLARGPLRARLGAVPPRAWVAALVLFNLALALRLFWAPHMPQVYLDEISFLNTSENMARGDVNLLSTVDAPAGDHFHPCPAGWQFLISRAYRALGVHAEVAFTLASVLSAASVVLLFLVLLEMTGKARVGLWGGLFLAVLPVHVRLSGSAALETPSLFFLLATLYAMMLWRATRSRSTLLLMAVMFAWFANMRMENSFALGPLLLLYLWLLAPPTREDAWAAAGAALAALVFSLPAVLADVYGVATRFYFFYQSPEMTHAHIVSNWKGNLPYWFDDAFHPLLLTLLALVGVAQGLATPGLRRHVGFWTLWAGGLIVFYTMNPSCDFALRHTLDSWRTALHPALGVVVLAAIGSQGLVEMSSRLRPLAVAALLAAACLTPWQFRDFVQMRHLWMVQWEAMQQMRHELPPDAWLLVYDHSTSLSPNSPGLAYELALTTGVRPHFFIFPETYGVDRAQPPPQIVHDVEAWTVEKRRLFLYHLDAGTVQDSHDLLQMQALFDLQPVAGTSMRNNHATFSLWRIEGPSPRLVAMPARKAVR